MPEKGVFRRIVLIGSLLLATPILSAFEPERLPAVAEKMRSAVTEVEQLLQANAVVADNWRIYLGLAEVRQQLDAGPDVDTSLLETIARRLTRNEPGLDRQVIRNYAAALKEWHQAMTPPEARVLWEQAQKEAASFQPVSASDVERQRQNCVARLSELDRLLATQGTNGLGWRKQIGFDAVYKAVRLGDWNQLPPEAGHVWRAARAIWPSKTLGAAHDSLQKYEVTRVLNETEETASKFHQRLALLAESYRLWRENPTQERQLQLSTLVHELEVRGQAQLLTKVVRFEHSRPNLVVRASAPFVAKQTQRPVSDVLSVNDTIGGRPVTGTATVSGDAYLKIVPSETAANLDIQFTAEMFSETSAYSRGVQVDTEGTTRLFGRKRMFLDALGMRHSAADVSANSDVQLQGISGGPLRRRIAERMFYNQQDQARVESEIKAAQRTAERLDQEVVNFQKTMSEGSAKNYLAPLFSTNSDLGRQWRTGTAAIEGRFWSAEPHEFAATSIAPSIDLGNGVSFQAHETFLERSMRERLGGRTLISSQLEQELSDMFTKVNPNAPQMDSEHDYAVTFAKEPARVKFNDDQLQLTLFVTRFESEKGNFPGIQVSAQYVMVCERPSLVLQRAGAVEVYPLDYRPDSSATIGGRQQVLRHFIERQFESHLRRTLVLEPIPASPKNGLKEPLDFVESRVKDGWMSLLMEPPAKTKR